MYKDHKGRTRDKGGVPLTRHVTWGNRGMNLHISKIASDILEPMLGRVNMECEVISAEDRALWQDLRTGIKVCWGGHPVAGVRG